MQYDIQRDRGSHAACIPQGNYAGRQESTYRTVAGFQRRDR